MSLAGILDAMERAAATDAQQLLDAARSDADAVLASARREAALAKERERQLAERGVREMRARLLADARLRTARLRARHRDAAVEAVFARAGEALAMVQGHQDYASALLALLAEALDEFGNRESLVVRCDPRDRQAVEQGLHDAGCSLPVEPSLRCWGGVIVQDAGGQVVADNTLERRLRRARQTLWWQIAKLVGTGHGL